MSVAGSAISQAILEAEAFIICTGAGMGVDSGLATFRGNTAKGWVHSETGAEIDYYDICQGHIFSKSNHSLNSEAWKFWKSCREAYTEALPHRGYQILLELIGKRPYTVFTTNVDRHWDRAGVPAIQLYEVHGSIEHLQCSRPRKESCRHLYDWTVSKCTGCQGPVRPNILMFNDDHYIDDHQLAIRTAYTRFIDMHRKHKVVVFIIGAGNAVQTLQHEVDSLLRIIPQATEVCINPDSRSSEYSLKMGVLEGLELLMSNP
jgi:NAD-dependent SIR2 family protein deacetylase